MSKLFWQVAFLICLCTFNVSASEWSKTTPPINLSHVFDGEINSRGKPVGFHVRPQGRDPENAQLYRVISGPNQIGIYTGEVEIYDAAEGRWKRKAFSSFFPDKLANYEIQNLILKAFANSKPNKRGKWRGKSGAGFQIEGWLCPKGGTPTCPDGAINTAYPIYKKDN
ncbi:EndoU domain-containing protein [Terasakiella sp. A23]|uniref:EndoU domain-containing protein n=1 Tax=Terasakiella sp. FCG-A23 TaxID=3080561 RepID=UPI002954729F|nr:EndoU domain-containing protein [Terasakiella sp. A23]MDV7341656.1 EndoU domain-containing protein [Terasakiella sp. A23]